MGERVHCLSLSRVLMGREGQGVRVGSLNTHL